jgi:isopropylmalate/homocitrate/citramalate synthase
VLGIGERNGITPLGGLVARMYVSNRTLIKKKYRLKKLRKIEQMVANLVGVGVPFNNYITGVTAFTHKAGIHAKAILNKPETYEIIDPRDFGMTRYISIAHKLTGWNAVKDRAEQLGLPLTDDQIKDVTAHIKALADQKRIDLNDVDEMLYRWADMPAEVAEKPETVETVLRKRQTSSNGEQIQNPKTKTQGKTFAEKALARQRSVKWSLGRLSTRCRRRAIHDNTAASPASFGARRRAGQSP